MPRFASHAPGGTGPYASKASLLLAWYAVIALSMVTSLGVVENALLLATAGAMALSMLLQPSLPARVAPVFWAFLCLFLIYAGLTLTNPSMRGVSNTITIFVAAMFFLFFARNGRRIVRHADSGWAVLGTAAAVLVVGLGGGMVAKNAVSGIAAYPILTAALIGIARGRPPVRTAFFAFTAIGVMGFLLGHRMMAGVSVVAMATFLAIWIVPLQLTRNAILAVLVAGIAMLFILYAGLFGLDIRDLDTVIKEASGRTAASGREFIWPTIFAATAANPWTGLGTGTLFSDLADATQSAHNYFLQIYMQSGVVGLGALALVLLSVWRAIGRPRRSDPVGVYVSTCLIIVLVHSSLEVFLMQGNPTIGCGAWILLGIGVGVLRDGPPQATAAAFQPAPGLPAGEALA